MGTAVPRAALLATVALLLLSVLAAIGPAQASTPTTYTLLGYVEGPGGASAPPVPAGVSVVLTSSATQQTYSAVTYGSGQFCFSSNTGSSGVPSGCADAPGLTPGWWQVSVPPQTHVALTDIPGQFVVLPQNQTSPYAYFNSTDLTSGSFTTAVSGVTVNEENVTINGTVYKSGEPFHGADVEVLSPTFNGFVLANNTTTDINNATEHLHPGYYSLVVPWGTWILETIIPGAVNYTNEQLITIDASDAPVGNLNYTVSPNVVPGKSFDTWGYAYLASKPSSRDLANGYVTLFNLTSGSITSVPVLGGYFDIGTPGAGDYEVCVATVGYTTGCFADSPTVSNPTNSSPKSIYVSATSPPANYTTTLNWSNGFNRLNVTTVADLGNDATFPQLPNATIGQLWAQLGLDWNHSLSFPASDWASVANWIDEQGPFFAAGQASTTVNGTGYGQPTNYTFADSTTCTSGSCGPSSAATAMLRWSQYYNLTTSVGASLKQYSISLNFRHPVTPESFNYTIVLPKGYVLAAGAGSAIGAPSYLVPEGPGGTWTKFTIVSKPASSPSSTFAFTVVRNGTITASVNVSADEFTWSTHNVLNESRGNYTAVAGVGENLTFSGANSTFPAGTNATSFAWNFGDGATNTTPNATTNHTYHAPGEYAGSLTVTSSGQAKSTVPFWIYVGKTAPTAVITVNDTKVQTASNGVKYIIVNWSAALQFNASMSTSPVASGSSLGGISVAEWNITDTSSQDWNFSWANAENPASNLTTTFDGQGVYITQGLANGTPIPGTFYGWQYNVTLTVWGYGGVNATTLMVVLVKDTEKPLPVITIKNGAGGVAPASGLVEAANFTALAVLYATNSSDPHNGSIVKYHWQITNSGNDSVNETYVRTPAAPSYTLPAGIPVWLAPQQKAYTINLTVTDRAGNTAYVTQSLTVAVNLTTRPVVAVSNLTAPNSMTDGDSYTITVNVTNIGGSNSTAEGTQVRFYLLPPSGSGAQIDIASSPASTQFYEWTNNTTRASTANATGSVNIVWNTTYQAVIHFTPSRTGTWDIWVNATATNEFVPDYTAAQNQAHVQATLNQSPSVGYEEDAAIVVVIVAVLVVIYLVVVKKVGRGGRLRSGSSSSSKSSSSGSSSKLERGSKKDEDDDDE